MELKTYINRNESVLRGVEQCLQHYILFVSTGMKHLRWKNATMVSGKVLRHNFGENSTYNYLTP